jgi:hypothetical protein
MATNRMPVDTLDTADRPEEGSASFWPRLLKGAALIVIGAAAHQWLLPAQHRANTAEPTGIVAAGHAAELAPMRPSPPRAPSPRSMPGPGAVALPENAGVIPVGTAGMIEATATFERDSTSPFSRALAAAAEPASTISDTPAPIEPSGPADPPSEDVEGSPSAASDPPPAGKSAAEVGKLQSVLTPAVSPLTAGERDTLLPSTPLLLRAVPAYAGSIRKARPNEDLAGVREVLQVYRTAYERLDAAAAKTVWPSLDATALNHAFRQLASQRLTFHACGISVSGESALARCRGRAEYVPKVGAHRSLQATGEWVFDLAKRDTSWQIVEARVR